MARRREEMKAKLRESARSVMQEKAFAEVMLKQQRKEKARTKEIERLWKKARRLYSLEMYEGAIKAFQKVITLEGEGEERL